MKLIVFRLLQTHQRLDQALRAEQRRRSPDPFRLARLKKLKLAVKDRLHAMTTRSRRQPA